MTWMGPSKLRIGASLDLGTVLWEVVDSARALTDARYGVIAAVGEAGEVQDFVSSGFTPDEHEQLAAWPDGPALFEHLRDLPESLRLADLPAYVRSLGYAPDLMRSDSGERRYRGGAARSRPLAQPGFIRDGTWGVSVRRIESEEPSTRRKSGHEPAPFGPFSGH